MDINKKMYIVKSTRQGVEEPVERVVKSMIYNVGQILSGFYAGKTIHRYKLDNKEFPFEVDIMEGGVSDDIEGHGTGVGDLWNWTYHCSMFEGEARNWGRIEEERVKRKYKLKKKGAQQL
jgi:hypothetical protein